MPPRAAGVGLLVEQRVRQTRAAQVVADGERGLLRIEDNGHGFNTPVQQTKGLGLRIMHYRAQLIAGSLRIESARSQSTTVSCWFPRS